jgi:predicted DNA-binding protein
MTVRKNFVFDDEVAQHLEELAKDRGTSMTAVIQEMIEASYADIEKRKKLEALKRIAGSASGLFGNLTIQEIKANMDV